MTAFRRYGMKTSECNLYTLLASVYTTRWTYLLAFTLKSEEFQLTAFSKSASFES